MQPAFSQARKFELVLAPYTSGALCDLKELGLLGEVAAAQLPVVLQRFPFRGAQAVEVTGEEVHAEAHVEDDGSCEELAG